MSYRVWRNDQLWKEQLYISLGKIIHQKRRVDPSFNCVRFTIQQGPIDCDFTDFPLKMADPSLHDGDKALLWGPHLKTMEICHLFVNYLFQRQQFNLWYDLGTEVLLWCAVR